MPGTPLVFFILLTFILLSGCTYRGYFEIFGGSFSWTR